MARGQARPDRHGVPAAVWVVAIGLVSMAGADAVLFLSGDDRPGREQLG